MPPPSPRAEEMADPPATHTSPHAPPAGVDGAPAQIVLRNRPFLLLWSAQAISMTAQNAIWFALMVVVEEATHSTTQMGLAILSAILPAVLWGLLAGVVVDHLNKKAVLVATNLLRAAVVLGYLLYQRSLLVVYGVSLVFSSISQFFGPAEAAKIPLLVAKPQLLTANSFFNLTFIGSQLAGLVLLGPLMAKLFGPAALFGVGSAIYLIAGVLVSFLPGAEPLHKALAPLLAKEWATVQKQLWAEVREAWALIGADRRVSLAIAHLTLAASLVLVLSMLAPRFVVGVLSARADDAAYILWPAGLGMVAATILMGRLAARFGQVGLINFGLLALAVLLLALSVVDPLDDYLLARHVRWWAWLGAVPAVMALALFLGAQFALVAVPSQTILMERTPVSARARIFAVQMMLGNLGPVIPLLFLGGLADLIGVHIVLGLMGVALCGVWAAGLRHERQALRQKHPSP